MHAIFWLKISRHTRWKTRFAAPVLRGNSGPSDWNGLMGLRPTEPRCEHSPAKSVKRRFFLRCHIIIFGSLSFFFFRVGLPDKSASAWSPSILVNCFTVWVDPYPGSERSDHQQSNQSNRHKPKLHSPLSTLNRPFYSYVKCNQASEWKRG